MVDSRSGQILIIGVGDLAFKWIQEQTQNFVCYPQDGLASYVSLVIDIEEAKADDCESYHEVVSLLIANSSLENEDLSSLTHLHIYLEPEYDG